MQIPIDPEIMSLPDEEVLSRSVSEPRLFELIVERYEEALLRKAKYILGTDEDAEDAVQEAFVKIYINASKFKKQEGASFKSWAYRILINHCFTAYRKHKGQKQFRVDLDPEFMEMVADGSGAEFEKRLDTDEVVSYISKLPDILADVLRLHFVEGKPQKEISRMIGISEGAVRARIHRAKRELKDSILN